MTQPADKDDDFETGMQRLLEARIADLPTDPSLLLGLLEQRHLLELSAWEACPEFVALKRAISARTAANIAEATELSDADRRAVTLFSSAPRTESTSVERHLGNQVVKAAEELLGNLQATADIDPQRWALMENLVEQIDWLKGFVHHGGFACPTNAAGQPEHDQQAGKDAPEAVPAAPMTNVEAWRVLSSPEGHEGLRALLIGGPSKGECSMCGVSPETAAHCPPEVKWCPMRAVPAPTPRTDAAGVWAVTEAYSQDVEIVKADFARQLERELAAVRSGCGKPSEPQPNRHQEARKVCLFAAGVLRGQGQREDAQSLTEAAGLIDELWDDYMRLLREKQDRIGAVSAIGQNDTHASRLNALLEASRNAEINLRDGGTFPVNGMTWHALHVALLPYKGLASRPALSTSGTSVAVNPLDVRLWLAWCKEAAEHDLQAKYEDGSWTPNALGFQHCVKQMEALLATVPSATQERG